MTTARPFRFGVGLAVSGSRKEWADKCRAAEELGYDVISVADHLGSPAPFPALVAAAEATTRPRLATAVLNAGFYNPTLLARDITTTKQPTGGRLEVGLGAGYVKAEFDQAHLPWLSARERVDRLVTHLSDLEQGPPLWLAGRGDRMLRIAARKADIVGFTAFTTNPDGRLSYLDTIEAIGERVRFVKDLLGARLAHVELNILVWRVLITTVGRGMAAFAAVIEELSR